MLFLRSLTEADCEGPYVTWFNDREVCFGNSHHVMPYTIDDAKSYVRNQVKNDSTLVLAIIDAKKEIHIGNIALDKINYINRSAELSIIIGEKVFWSKSYGKQACRILCDHGFFVLNLHRIYCNTFENNTGMQKIAEHLGMPLEGRRRQAVFKEGRYLDILEYGVLRSEYMTHFDIQKPQ